jgi:uncharacterized protein (TIGR03067 family)
MINMRDLDQLQGRWQIVALEIEGRDVPKETFVDAQIIIDGDNFATAGMGASYSGKISLDQTRHPKTFDITFSDGPHAGGASLGLYMLEQDRWTICIGFAGYERPVDFHTSPQSGHALETLRREIDL